MGQWTRYLSHWTVGRMKVNRCLHVVAIPVAAFIEMPATFVATGAITATRFACVRRSLGRKTPFSRRESIPVFEDDRRPDIMQLNTEGVTAIMISVIEQAIYTNKALVIVLGNPLHCADKVIMTHFFVAGSSLSRKHGLATFVHERMELSRVDQSPEQSETEWLCADIVGYKIINAYKPPPSRFTRTANPYVPTPQSALWQLQLTARQLGI